MNKKIVYIEGKPVVVSADVYSVLRSEPWRIYKSARRHGECNCGRWQQCKGDCGACRHQVEGDMISADALRENYCNEPEAIGADPEEIVVDQLRCEELMRLCEEIDPDGRRIVELLAAGYDDRTAAAILGVPRSTYSRRKLRLRGEVRRRWR